MRRFIFASHHYLAYGLKDTVDFLTSAVKQIYDINAYVQDQEQDLEVIVQDLFASFDEEDEVIVLTDLLGGSVYQKFYPYISDRVHVICGMNLPLAMAVILAPDDQPFCEETLEHIIEECKHQIVYVNKLHPEMDGDDE